MCSPCLSGLLVAAHPVTALGVLLVLTVARTAALVSPAAMASLAVPSPVMRTLKTLAPEAGLAGMVPTGPMETLMDTVLALAVVMEVAGAALETPGATEALVVPVDMADLVAMAVSAMVGTKTSSRL